MEGRLEIALVDRDGRTTALPADGRRIGAFHASSRFHPLIGLAGVVRAWEVELSVVCEENRDGLGVQVGLPLEAAAKHFMVPGLIYGENRTGTCAVRYPRVDLEERGGDALSSHRWAFRIDRASHGAVFAWTDSACIALATDETSALGNAGLGFCGGDESRLWLNFPAREEPVTFTGYDAPAPAEVMTHDWHAAEIVLLRFLIFLLPCDPHAYDAVLRHLYQRDREMHDLNPWMAPEEGAALAAHGLHRWHYRPSTGVLVETTAFHRESDELAPVTGDREAMHVGWLSGAPAAYALLSYGRAQEIAEYVDAGISVLETIATGVAPCGTFWGRWTAEGWDGGWNGHRDLIHSRTVAEATLFMLRAIQAEKARGVEHPAWETAVASSLDFIRRSQRADGAFPALIDGPTGKAGSWEGAAGLLWIPALLESSEIPSVQIPSPGTGEGQGGGFCEAAERAGAYYAHFVEEEFIFGAPEDVGTAPTSEDGYNAVMAFVALYEATHSDEWLRLAKRAAEWMLSFRWSYNLVFPRHTLLQSYDYRSRGADLASPRNQHLHNYGLICLPEMMRLSELSGDPYYHDRAVDSLACSLQFIAREDGDFNARKGMITERYYNSRCFGPKGAILPVSHAWSAGLVLYACQAGLPLDA